MDGMRGKMGEPPLTTVVDDSCSQRSVWLGQSGEDSLLTFHALDRARGDEPGCDAGVDPAALLAQGVLDKLLGVNQTLRGEGGGEAAIQHS